MNANFVKHKYRQASSRTYPVCSRTPLTLSRPHMQESLRRRELLGWQLRAYREAAVRCEPQIAARRAELQRRRTQEILAAKQQLEVARTAEKRACENARRQELRESRDAAVRLEQRRSVPRPQARPTMEDVLEIQSRQVQQLGTGSYLETRLQKPSEGIPPTNGTIVTNEKRVQQRFSPPKAFDVSKRVLLERRRNQDAESGRFPAPETGSCHTDSRPTEHSAWVAQSSVADTAGGNGGAHSQPWVQAGNDNGWSSSSSLYDDSAMQRLSDPGDDLDGTTSITVAVARNSSNEWGTGMSTPSWWPCMKKELTSCASWTQELM